MKKPAKPTTAPKIRKKHSHKTLKVLFALSGNQCAHPDCTNTLIEPPTQESDAVVTAHICHIYAASIEGPRGKAGLTEKELNSLENLILLCRHHHGVVDGQHETYPAETLKQWKQQHELRMQERLSADLGSVQPDIFSHPYFPKALVDQKIQEEVDVLRKARFFMEFNRIQSSLILGKRLVDGELSGGTEAVRSPALAWCARILSRSQELDKAEDFLNLAKVLQPCTEVQIAAAFLTSAKGDKKTALSILASIDSPMSRTTSLQVVSHHDGSQAAADWAKSAGIGVNDLDADGKFALLSLHLELGHWDAAQQCLDALTDDDFQAAPILHHMAAVTHLLNTVPNELRALVSKQIPFDAADFPLASDAAGIEARRLAHGRFVKAAQIARQLNCPRTATTDDEYELWLELRDPHESQTGRDRLQQKLRDAKTALRLVHLGLQFRLKLDLEAVEREIERQIALNGGLTYDAAIARFAFAFTQKTPEQVANYIARHADQLAEFLDKKLLLSLQIEMLSRAGLPERANACLNVLLEDGLSELEQGRLRRVIAEAQGTDPVEARKEQFKKTDFLADLGILVDELETKGEWDALCDYGRLLFDRTNSLQDAERLAKAYSNAGKQKELLEFLRTNTELLPQSKTLQLLYCWSLYHEGALLEARSELASFRDQLDDPNVRALHINLGIALGDWHSLTAIVANECAKKDKRSALELIGAAQLTLHLGSSNAKDLIFAAAREGKDDARILATAYLLASQAGWEDDAEVYKWLQDAAALSGDNGPIQRASLKDVLNRKPDWDRRESETWQQLGRGEIPLFIAAHSLNKSLIGLTLFPALGNLAENDPRRRGAVPAYSGKRPPMVFNQGTSAGIDATALLTLSFLNLLDKALDSFDRVFIPHSTLSWLFEEKQKATFHQPSRIKDAHHVRHLLATDALAKHIPAAISDSDLSAQVGEDLASFISDAQKGSDEDGAQRIVVRASPVHRIGSLMEEEADLTAHVSVLSSCQAVVDRLRQKGQITAEQEKKARAFLQLHEKPWPNQPEITDGAILYLDDVAVDYLLHLGMLEKLKTAGFRPIISSRRISEINELISYENISGRVNDAIESIRSALHSRIESGKVKLGSRANIDPSPERSISEHPTFGVLTLLSQCDAILVDDRFINQHTNIVNNSGTTPIFSTLDLLDRLLSTESITPEERTECRTLLRRAGYFFIPISDDELERHIQASAIKDGKIIETAELKAIRENVLRIRMSSWLQLPKEAPWLDSLLKTFIRALKGLWKDGADLSSVRVQSDWILDQIEVRGWAQSFAGDVGDNIVKTGRGAYILMLLSPPIDAPPDIKDQYWLWVEDRVLASIKEQYPDLYSWLIEWHREQIAKMVETDVTEGPANDE